MALKIALLSVQCSCKKQESCCTKDTVQFQKMKRQNGKASGREFSFCVYLNTWIHIPPPEQDVYAILKDRLGE